MTTKQKKYTRIHEQLKGLLEKDTNFIAQLATINAILYHKFSTIFWVGFYLKYSKRLIVGPYQGPVACQELSYKKGVCWASICKNEGIIVGDVESFPDHIACDSRSKSELVMPIRDSKKNIIAVLDIDSDKLNNFDQVDFEGIQKISTLLNIDYIDSYFNDKN